MNKDLIAGQIRTRQIIADSKVQGKPGLVILDDSSPGASSKRGEGYDAATQPAGADVFLFVSGSKSSMGTSHPGITLFGGDVAVSGSTRLVSASVESIFTSDYHIDLNPVPTPSATLTGTVLAQAGNVNVGSHGYTYSFVTSKGETDLSSNQNIIYTATTTAGNQQVSLTVPTSSDPRVTARKIYRSLTNQPWWYDIKLVGTISDNTTTTFTDNIADASRGTSINSYKENTTHKQVTKNGVASMYIGATSVALGPNAYRNLASGTATGGSNIVIGYNAGLYLSSGDQNVCIGASTGQSLTNGTSNVLIHGNWQNNPSYCVNIGRNAGALNSGHNNVCLGYGTAGSTAHNYGVSVGASANNYTSGPGNVALGYYANYTPALGTGGYNISIGTCVKPPDSGSSGQINIGNVLYGKNAYQSVAAVTSQPTALGSVGIGVQVPMARLHLTSGTTAAGTAPLKFTSGSLMTSPEPGATEFSGSLYFTNGNSERKEVCLKTTYVQMLTPTVSSGAGYEEQTFTVNGLTTFDTVVINGPAQPAGVVLLSARVSATNTIAVAFGFTGSGLTPTADIYKIIALR